MELQPPVPMQVGLPPCQTVVSSVSGDGCTLAVPAGFGVNLRGPENNKKNKCEVFSSEALKGQLDLVQGGPQRLGQGVSGLEFGGVECLEVRVVNPTHILCPQPKRRCSVMAEMKSNIKKGIGKEQPPRNINTD